MGATPLITTNNPQNTRSTKPDQTTTFEWAPGFAPASASELAKGLHALTWNDRPLDQWD